MARPVSEKFIKNMQTIDSAGSKWKLFIRQNDKYSTRYVLEFSLNNKVFHLQNFSTTSQAKSAWELIELISKKGEG